MTRTVELHEAQALLAELIAGLRPDEEVQITQNHKTVARIVLPKPPTPQFGRCKGMLTIVSDDDEHLKDFEEYLY